MGNTSPLCFGYLVNLALYIDDNDNEMTFGACSVILAALGLQMA